MGDWVAPQWAVARGFGRVEVLWMRGEARPPCFHPHDLGASVGRTCWRRRIDIGCHTRGARGCERVVFWSGCTSFSPKDATWRHEAAGRGAGDPCSPTGTLEWLPTRATHIVLCTFSCKSAPGVFLTQHPDFLSSSVSWPLWSRGPFCPWTF